MIASLRGVVVGMTLDHVVVETGGVGLAVSCPPRVLADLRLGESASLFTSLVVREDSMTLYGFASTDERGVFDTLLTISGIGPRLALAMLAVLTPHDLQAAVAADDVATLTRVPGIGRKGAQRLVLELKDRLPAVASMATAPGAVPTAQPSEAWSEQVSAALVSLGWGARDAAAAIEAVSGEAAEMAERGAVDVAALLRTALRSLDRS